MCTTLLLAMGTLFVGAEENSEDGDDDHVAVMGKHKEEGNKRKVLGLEDMLRIRGELQKYTNLLKE